MARSLRFTWLLVKFKPQRTPPHTHQALPSYATSLFAAFLGLCAGCTQLQATPTVPPAPESGRESNPAASLPPSPSTQKSPAAEASTTPPAEPTLPKATPRPRCLSGSGRMEIGELVDPALPRSLPYRIYLPPCYDDAVGEQLPVLYALHGLQRTDSQWDDLGADEVAQQLIASGAAPPFLIVMPWERLGLDFEDTIVSYLIPFIEQTYGAGAQPEFRAIGGISRGAGWALRIGLKHPDLFAAIGLHSPAVLPPDMYELPRWMEAVPAGPLPDLWIDIGDRDTLRFSAIELTELLDDLGVSYHWEMPPGEHVASYWESSMARYMDRYVSAWRDGEQQAP